MGITDGSNGGASRTFARDVLSIEIAGPGRPQLTVVDLPGLIQNENEDGDKALVEELTTKYISQSRTICLAIITAANDADNQRILSLVKKADPEGNRSLGIITKPDTLPENSGSERSFIDLARNANKKYFFKLGWHVLKNRKFEENEVTFEERNKIETTYFRTSNFKELPQTSFGIDALRHRLSEILFEHIKRELPEMRSEVDKMLSNNHRKLSALGTSRTTAEECREYLMDVSERMLETGKNALQGNYDGEFFQSNHFIGFSTTSEWAIRRLRALIQQTNDDFAQRMREKGHTFHFGPKPSTGKLQANDFASEEELSILNEVSEEPIPVPYGVALTWVQKMIARNRGRELQGNYNPLVIGELYQVSEEYMLGRLVVFLADEREDTD